MYFEYLHKIFLATVLTFFLKLGNTLLLSLIYKWAKLSLN